MGCSFGKASALQELNLIIKQISLENHALEKERDKLRSQHDDRPEEEKDSLQDLRVMHSDLEKEIKELKDIMMDFIPQSETESSTVSVRAGIEKITEIQKELEEKSLKIREMITKREEIKKEHENLENLIVDTEKQISELEAAIENQEETLRDQENIEEKLQIYEKEKADLIEELKDAENIYKELSEEVKNWEGEEVNNNADKHSYEALLSLSEADVNRELKVVERELEDLSAQIKDLEQKEVELQHMDSYIANLQEKLNSNSKNANVRKQIEESQERIEYLKKEKKKVKDEVSKLRKFSNGGVEATNMKINALNQILEKKTGNVGKGQDNLINDVELVLKRAKEMSINLNSH
jgi:chromosome segregation ATPase